MDRVPGRTEAGQHIAPGPRAEPGTCHEYEVRHGSNVTQGSDIDTRSGFWWSWLRVSIGLLPAGARNVAFAAVEIASLAQLFPGRTDIGVGHGMPGWMRSVGQWPGSPLTFLHEYVDALRALLRGEAPEVRGRVRAPRRRPAGERRAARRGARHPGGRPGPQVPRRLR
ncbi:LLM class flavin-dependent oxidoreductase [Streptomyces cyaneofuscatus]|uniref:LLM class flavin-dependent oxidoreductase n=1 Tax=Streptomyces cyaneofuscatus TaxID=66883 RepID=UPI0036490C28